MDTAEGPNRVVFFGYSFQPNKACLLCEHVFSGKRPVRIIAHDLDGWIQFLCGDEAHDPKCSKVVALEEVLRRHPIDSKDKVLNPGCFAELSNSLNWVIYEM